MIPDVSVAIAIQSWPTNQHSNSKNDCDDGRRRRMNAVAAIRQCQHIVDHWWISVQWARECDLSVFGISVPACFIFHRLESKYNNTLTA